MQPGKDQMELHKLITTNASAVVIVFQLALLMQEQVTLVNTTQKIHPHFSHTKLYQAMSMEKAGIVKDTIRRWAMHANVISVCIA